MSSGFSPCSRPKLRQQRLHCRPAPVLRGLEDLSSVALLPDQPPVTRQQATQHLGLLALLLGDLLVVLVLETHAGLEAMRPEDLASPLHGPRIADKQPARAITAVHRAPQQAEGVDALTRLRPALGDLPISPPVLAVVLLRQVVARRTPALHVDRVVIEPRLAVFEQPSPATDGLPALQHFSTQGLGVDPLIDEPQFVRVRMPAVPAVRQLQRPDQALKAIAALELLPGLTGPQAPQRGTLLLNQLIQVIP